MGVSTWTQTLLEPDGAELRKPPPPSTRRSNQPSEPNLKCPRCDSTNTKFCYYNNYNKSQPRHFCKACKRHWTKGGTLRNVPVGGGRKNKRLKTSTASSTTTNFGATTNPTTTCSVLPFGAFLGNNGSSTPKNQNPGFEFSSLSNTFNNIDSSSLFIPTSYHQSLNAYDFAGNRPDTAEESTVTTVNPSTSNTVTEYLWGGPITESTLLDVPNSYWNDIDLLTSSDLINISWDDTEIKP